MNRRQFTQSILATGGALAAPTRFAIGAMGTSPAAAYVAKTGLDAYGMAGFAARIHDNLTLETFIHNYSFPPDVATDLMQHLIKTNVIAPANAQGVFKAIDYFDTPAPIQNIAAKQPDARKSLSQIKHHFDECDISVEPIKEPETDE
ncbi:hypothetical protein GCM10008927_17420 [Amylibacter ulvae]|uniref:Uncharacterized protein n=1 Tax=Paramylibacter ulvae TaxID=1651968 RepID=A0ABQ3D169_9RHOB|nr:hypothetical protein [Amylibacter ulvae]GHA52465.1 hypothetical protein GCM10008927_17420 [Amylibacter ulvae]